MWILDRPTKCGNEKYTDFGQIRCGSWTDPRSVVTRSLSGVGVKYTQRGQDEAASLLLRRPGYGSQVYWAWKINYCPTPLALPPADMTSAFGRALKTNYSFNYSSSCPPLPSSSPEYDSTQSSGRFLNPFTAMLAVSSLGKRPVKVPNLKSLRPFRPSRIAIKMHSTKSIFLVGPSNMLFADVYECTV